MGELSARFVRTITDPGKYYDRDGLMLRVRPTGSKQWIWRGTVQGKRVDLGLGGYPHTSLAKARRKAARCRKLARAGRDPRELNGGTPRSGDAIGRDIPTQPSSPPGSHRRSDGYLEHGGVAAALKTVRKCREWLLNKLALEFLVLTAGRCDEVLGARWEEINLDDHVWTVPATRMKGGTEHRVPLSGSATEVLAHARDLTGGAELVFFYRTGLGPSESAFSKLLKKHGIPATPLDFRRLFRDWCVANQVCREVADAALAHVGRDNPGTPLERGDLFELRRGVMEDWGRYVTRASSSRSAPEVRALLQRATRTATSKDDQEKKLLDFMVFMIEKLPSGSRPVARSIARDLVKKEEAEWLVWFADARKDSFAWDVVMALVAHLRQRDEHWRLWRPPFFDWLLDVVQDPRSKPPGEGRKPHTKLTRDSVIAGTVHEMGKLGVRPVWDESRRSVCDLVAERIPDLGVGSVRRITAG